MVWAKKLHPLLLTLFVVLQLGYWSQTRGIKPNMEVVPNVPGKHYIEALTFGDKEFYFRVLAFQIQITGDTFGRFTALRDYDMEKLYRWFTLLDTLDSRSDMMPAMAAYYFSQSQNIEDVRYMVDYLYEHSVRDVQHKWWWLIQALYLSMHKLNDMDLALKVAKPLIDPKVPAWAQHMTAVVYEKRGEMDDALRIMETIKDNAEHITDRDLRYMIYFVKDRLKRLDKIEEMEKAKPNAEDEIPSGPNPNTPSESAPPAAQ